MTTNYKLLLLICCFFTLPILVSLDPITLNSSYNAKYESPEGIQFLSYTENWDEFKLEGLYKELIKNKHGEEIQLLQEVRIIGGPSPTDSRITGNYHPLLNSITLYNGNSNTDVSSYSDTLAHEYGHHFAYYYFPSHHFSFSKWAELRGLKESPVRWDSFWNYSLTAHQWHSQEIFAEDYVLLYGAVNEDLNVRDIYNSNEAFYLSTQHENQNIPNVLDNDALHQYLENETGVKIDESRKLKTPSIKDVTNTDLVYSISEKTNVAYRLNLTFYYNDEEIDYNELKTVTSDYTGNTISFNLDEILTSTPINTNSVSASIDVIDLNTAFGFSSNEVTINIQNNVLQSIN
ncbi:hypothetical protein [Fredinandcohnia sp. 179-A 10B2 NHS]|uniref:hypothetical protein n=1 Tax=Fredinandcohnia sp. 179-A 10B2 NHS TaxID=3235176 RepID=UPI0039A2F3ED